MWKTLVSYCSVSRVVDKKIKALLVVGAMLVLLIGGRVILSVIHPENDADLIKQALTDSIQASKEGRPGGVMDKLSDNISLNGQNEGAFQGDIAHFIKTNKPDIQVENMTPSVTGDEATIVSPVTLTLSFLGQSVSHRIKDVTLLFRKETDHDFLILPTTRWKLAEVRIPNSSLAGFGQLRQ